MIKIGAVWAGNDKDGNPMLTGQIGDARLVILKNGYKEQDKHPDYIVYIAENKKRDSDGDNEPPPQKNDIPF